MSLKVSGNVLTSNIVVGTQTLGSTPIRKNVLKFKTLTCPYLNVNGTTSGVSLSRSSFKIPGTLGTFNTNGVIVNGSIWTPTPPPFFNGYFTVKAGVVTAFYDFSQPAPGGGYVNVYINDSLQSENSIFNTVTLKFSSGGTNINITNNLYFKSLLPLYYKANIYNYNIGRYNDDSSSTIMDNLNFSIALISPNTYSIAISY